MGSENSARFGKEVRPPTGNRTSVKKGWRRSLVNDVLLMWTEALNESGARAEAIEKVNEVRKIAGGALLNSNAATMVGGQQDLRERIRNERRIEYPGEGINYFDELRWKTWADKVFFPGNGRK